MQQKQRLVCIHQEVISICERLLQFCYFMKTRLNIWKMFQMSWNELLWKRERFNTEGLDITHRFTVRRKTEPFGFTWFSVLIVQNWIWSPSESQIPDLSWQRPNRYNLSRLYWTKHTHQTFTVLVETESEPCDLITGRTPLASIKLSVAADQIVPAQLLQLKHILTFDASGSLRSVHSISAGLMAGLWLSCFRKVDFLCLKSLFDVLGHCPAAWCRAFQAQRQQNSKSRCSLHVLHFSHDVFMLVCRGVFTPSIVLHVLPELFNFGFIIPQKTFPATVVESQCVFGKLQAHWYFLCRALVLNAVCIKTILHRTVICFFRYCSGLHCHLTVHSVLCLSS